jgi:hypothetical protein
VPVFLRDETSLLFMHVPKTGGTSIEQHFRNAGFRIHFRATRKTERLERFRLRRCSPQHFHGALVQEILRIDRFDAIFMIVRDPIDRFRSEYAMRHVTHPEHAEAGRLDPDEVEAWAEQMLAVYAKRNPYVRDNHLRPQHEFEVPGTLVYRLEDGLGPVIADLDDRLGLDLPREVPHALSRQQAVGVSSRDVPVSSTLEKRLREFYAEDFNRYGY